MNQYLSPFIKVISFSTARSEKTLPLEDRRPQRLQCAFAVAEENTGRSSPGSSHDLSNHEDIRSEFTKKKKGRATPTCQSSKASEAAAGFQGAGALAALRQGRGRSRKAAPQTTWAPTRPGALGGSSWGVMAGSVQGSGSRALDLLRTLPRVSLANLKPNPGSRKLERRPRGRRRGRRCGRGTDKGERQRGTRPRLGFEGGQTPFYIQIPKYGFNEGHSFRRRYQPLSLNRLQCLIDLGRVDPTQPIDLTQLVNGRGVTIQPYKRDYGVQLVEEGADTFKAKVNIEVQLASELAIAAIEESGGVVTTAFCDPRSLEILCKPVPFFLRGQPIPKRMLAPEALVPYYTDAKNRGDLADPAKFPEARLELAQKYGYILPDVTKDELFKVTTRKDPRQIFFGLAPGRVVNMADKKILKPTEENVLKYYSS
ncbi:LOW QUALITY PROTEIN: large ribosomal subunit protein uL15m-like [Equus caballus]|uniref:LOW QUALITY PROTEIN: large ribosomal subunit protein uL15m-like n=1 Tax=Equus caballus TaxID=9796 RepID=UPI0038B2F15C